MKIQIDLFEMRTNDFELMKFLFPNFLMLLSEKSDFLMTKFEHHEI